MTIIDRTIGAGKSLRGKLILEATKELPDAKISLSLSGCELTKILQRFGYHTLTDHEEKVIWKTTAVLKAEGGHSISSGMHVYPFKFVLSDSLPTSMEGSKDNRDFWAIKYRLTVNASSQKKSYSNLAKFYIDVIAKPLPNVYVPARVKPTMLPVKSFGRDLGNLAIAAAIDDAHVGRGTVLNIRLAIRNFSNAKISRVEMILEETVSWNAKKNGSTTKCTVTRLDDVNVPGIIRNKMKRDAVRALHGAVLEDKLRELHNDLSSKQNMVQMTVPNFCKDTFAGSLIKITHNVKITLYTESFVSDHSITVPLKIG